MKRSSFTFLLLAATMLFAAPASHASLLHFSAQLNGPSESPPNASPGIGFALVDIDTLLNTMHVHAEFSGLGAPTTASHIHCCTIAPGTGTAGVATQTPSFVGFPLGVTSGVFDSVFDLTAAATYNPAFVTASGGTVAGAEAALIAGISGGRSYYNIHTTAFPAGEIRGFLLPEPGVIGLLALALGAASVVTRRRRR